jgi:hypothetical protein
MGLHLPDGTPLARIENNELILQGGGLQDFEFVPGATSFALSHGTGVKLAMTFRRHDEDAVKKILTSRLGADLAAKAIAYVAEHARDSEGCTPCVDIRARLFTQELELHATENAVRLFLPTIKQRASLGPRIFGVGAKIAVTAHGRELFSFG